MTPINESNQMSQYVTSEKLILNKNNIHRPMPSNTRCVDPQNLNPFCDNQDNQSGSPELLDQVANFMQRFMGKLISMFQQLLENQTLPPTETPPTTDPGTTPSTPPETTPPNGQEPTNPPQNNLPGTDCTCPDKENDGVDAGVNNIVWRPKSKHDGNLVIILPKDLDLKAVKIWKGDKLIEKGEISSNQHTNRNYIRFDKPGQKYPKGCVVEVILKNGEKKRYTIDQPADKFKA